VKVALQLEFGKNAIYTGTFIMHNFNQLPGFKIGKAHWSIWLWLSLQGLKLLQVGGIVGGVAIVLNMAFPFISVNFWAIISVLITSFWVYRGNYGPVEKGSLVMIILFTAVILISCFVCNGTQYAIHWAQIENGSSIFATDSAGRNGIRRIWYYGCRWRRDHVLQLLVHRKGLCRLYRSE
jgi:manganese transport protein